MSLFIAAFIVGAAVVAAGICIGESIESLAKSMKPKRPKGEK